MAKGMIALAGGALALLLVSALPESAEARRDGGGNRGGGGQGSYGGGGSKSYGGGGSKSYGGGGFKSYGGGGFKSYGGGGNKSYGGGGHKSYGHQGHSHRHHRRRHIFIGAPDYYYDSYGYGDGCYWLRLRAVRTGSSYWWNRYHACVGNYD